jgi:hypothetical protein
MSGKVFRDFTRFIYETFFDIFHLVFVCINIPCKSKQGKVGHNFQFIVGEVGKIFSAADKLVKNIAFLEMFDSMGGY